MNAPVSVPAAPRVLVLLAARNGAEWIERQIVTVLRQRDVVVLVDVRDDESSDATRAIVEGMAARDPRVRLRADHLASGSAAGNFFRLIQGADARGFDFVALSDQDDEWFEDKLARAIAWLSRRDADGYSAAVQARWANGAAKALIQQPNQRLADYLFEGAGQGCTFVLQARLFFQVQTCLRRAAVPAAALHYHDWAVYALTRSLALRWIMDPEPCMIYHQHAGNDTGARSSLGGLLRRFAKIRNGWYRSQVRAVATFVRAINPEDAQAIRWEVLSAQRGMPGVLRRFGFVCVHGRRRFSDRVVQAFAVLCGDL